MSAVVYLLSIVPLGLILKAAVTRPGRSDTVPSVHTPAQRLQAYEAKRVGTSTDEALIARQVLGYRLIRRILATEPGYRGHHRPRGLGPTPSHGRRLRARLKALRRTTR